MVGSWQDAGRAFTRWKRALGSRWQSPGLQCLWLSLPNPRACALLPAPSQALPESSACFPERLPCTPLGRSPCLITRNREQRRAVWEDLAWAGGRGVTDWEGACGWGGAGSCRAAGGVGRFHSGAAASPVFKQLKNKIKRK